MKHENAVRLLVSHGAEVRCGPYGRWEAIVGEHRLTWRKDPVTGMIRLVRYYPDENSLDHRGFARPDERSKHKLLVKRFLSLALTRRWKVNDDLFCFGPREESPEAETALVVYRDERRLFFRSPEALAMGRATASGECPPEVLADWTRDHESEAGWA